MTALARPPGDARSSVRPEIVTGSRVPSWSYFIPDEHETVDAWRWPQRIDTSEGMVNDPQVAAIETAVTQPPQRYRRYLDPNGMDPTAAALLADDLDLPLVGQQQSAGRSPLRFNGRRHFARMLRCLRHGITVFEIVGRIDEQGRWRLDGLQPIPPRTITRFDVDRAGRLVAVWQWDARSMRDVEIPADHLVVYTWGGDNGDPSGRSMLRPLYRPWIAKDRLVRLDLLKHERNSMGIPFGTLPEGASQADRDIFERLLAGLSAGEGTNVVGPDGSKLALLGVSGQTSDVVGSLRFQNEEMARASATMVLQAGQTGNGTLTSAATHDDYLRMVHDVIVQLGCDVQTEQAAARWAIWNGIEPTARVVFEREEADQPRASGTPEGAVPVEATGRRARPNAPRAARARRPVTAAASNVPVPDRELRRQPTALEAASGVDFLQIDTDWTTVQDRIAAELATIRRQLGQAAVDALANLAEVEPLLVADTLTPVLTAAVGSVDIGALVDALTEAADAGVAQVVGEADRQGTTIRPGAVDYADRAQLEARAAVSRLARSLAETAQNAAVTSAPAGASGQAVADVVSEAVDRLTDAQPQQAAAGATSRAQNAGRAHALDTADYVEIYGSALLDSNTCGPCIDWDGRTFETMDEALAQYPGGGGNADCEGGDRCRCVLVGVLATEQERAT